MYDKYFHSSPSFELFFLFNRIRQAFFYISKYVVQKKGVLNMAKKEEKRGSQIWLRKKKKKGVKYEYDKMKFLIIFETQIYFRIHIETLIYSINILRPKFIFKTNFVALLVLL